MDREKLQLQKNIPGASRFIAVFLSRSTADRGFLKGINMDSKLDTFVYDLISQKILNDNIFIEELKDAILSDIFDIIKNQVTASISQNPNIRYFGTKLNDEIKEQISNILKTDSTIKYEIEKVNSINGNMSWAIKKADRVKSSMKYIRSELKRLNIEIMKLRKKRKK